MLLLAHNPRTSFTRLFPPRELERKFLPDPQLRVQVNCGSIPNWPENREVRRLRRFPAEPICELPAIGLGALKGPLGKGTALVSRQAHGGRERGTGTRRGKGQFSSRLEVPVFLG